MRYKLIDAKKADFPIDRMCDILDVSSSGYYAWRKRQPSRRQLDDMVYLAHIRSLFGESNGTYGSPRMHVDLTEEGLSIGRHRTARLMRENGLVVSKTRAFSTTKHGKRRASNAQRIALTIIPLQAIFLIRIFPVKVPMRNGVLTSAIYGQHVMLKACKARRWLYLAIVLDLFSRRIIGWSVSDRLKKGLAIKALQRAIDLRQPSPGVIHHSDRGSQYCSGDYQKLLAKHKFVPSMSGKGNCYDNAR